MPDDPRHAPVLLRETLELLGPQPGQIYADGTFGRGGHASAFAERIGPEGTVVGVDLDEENLAFATARVASLDQPPRIVTRHGSFVEIPDVLQESSLRADMLLIDLGFSSSQMDDPRRGFAFRESGPLDMRYDRSSRGQRAADLVNGLSERELADLIFRVGEDPFARRIARKLVEYRRTSPIETTETLARLVREAYGSRARQSRMDPATRTFMALRIAVNDELAALDALLASVTREARRRLAQGTVGESGSAWLEAEARVGIIAFHSLEDRRVKHAFRELAREGAADLLTPKPVTAAEAEVAANPRARSAKLRVLRLKTRETTRESS